MLDAKPDLHFEPALFTILIVDDEEANRDQLSRRLARRGFNVRVASSGAEALATLSKTTIDLVILDVMMPGLSGFETLAAIRAGHAAHDMPIIMASARTDSEAMTQCLTAGANDYVTKPLDFPVVLARVQTQLTIRVAVEQVQSSEARYRTLAELSPDLISLHDANGVFRFASAASLPLLGFEADELLGTRFHDLVAPEDRDQLPVRLGDLPDGCTLVVNLQKKNGDLVPCEIRTRCVKGARTGRTTDVQCSIREISLFTARSEVPVRRRS